MKEIARYLLGAQVSHVLHQTNGGQVRPPSQSIRFLAKQYFISRTEKVIKFHVRLWEIIKFHVQILLPTGSTTGPVR